MKKTQVAVRRSDRLLMRAAAAAAANTPANTSANTSANISANISPNTSPNTTSSVPIRSVRYGECQKNQAANIGRYAVDGCGEFLASGAEGTEGFFICAACECHRNFHRRVVVDNSEVVCEHTPINNSRNE
ncbi:hypothetical protein SAY86_005889 [Trapa natans]|uniref:ZF-HD dimerization-type domain-containing protein n=1 Tax=Trapa natans TaxID=22666 RepID=A0AAN7L9T0_TRANT|nr:hypothetical protein SAY86_005889 [Trapa natans]